MSHLHHNLDDFYPSRFPFGSTYFPHNVLIHPHPLEHSLVRSHSYPNTYLKKLEKKMHVGKDGFEVCLDVEHFSPNEITVKMENNSIIVHAKHEEKKDDHGYISREFTRRYELPKKFKPEYVTSTLSSDGILSLKCPHTPAIEGVQVRHVKIEQTGPIKQSIKNDEAKNEEKTED